MLPRLLPMLAVPAGPFDSPDYCFELKWDGIRALAAVDQGGWRLWGREQADYTAPHNHFPADLSCVVYLEAEPGCAPLVFSGSSAYQPRPQTLIMFPGITRHEVPATPGRRVVVAMNLFKQLAQGPAAAG